MNGRRASRMVAAAALAAVVVAACADDVSPTLDDDGSAIIVTTTVPATATTTNERSTTTNEPSTTTVQPTATSPTTTPDDTSAPSAPTSADTSAPTTTRPVVGDPVVAAVEVARLRQPVDLVARPGDDALYVVQQTGQVVRVDDGEPTVVADVSDRTEPGGERGLLGLAFSVDGTRAYLDYTDIDQDTVVAEYPVTADGRFDVGAERVVLTVDQPYRNHNGGDLETGPDGMLFVTLGDGGSAGDPERRASDPTSLLGSLLRIDPAPSDGRPYSIPDDNPFASGTFGDVAGAPEVWAWGLRNPWKIAFDPVTGELWIADVGQNQYEEIDLAAPVGGFTAGRGLNFGWSAYEGNERFNADVADPGDLIFPVLTYEHGADGCSIAGGAPYRGTAIADLAPAYVYSDYCSGIVWALDLAGQRNLRLLDGFSDVTAVRTGPDGELYVLELGGRISRLVPG